jgi:GntR family transcriptional regulator
MRAMKRKHAMSSRDFATELVESYIQEQGLKPDDRLPSERDMCSMWDLNRTTLRNAIQRLVDTGVLYSKMGSGTFVAPPKFVGNLQDVYGFSESVRIAGRTPGSRVVFATIQEADKSIARKLHIPLGTEVFAMRRLRLIDDVPCSIETVFVNMERCAGVEQRDYGRESLFDVLRWGYGIKAQSGDEKISVTTLDAAEAELLEMEEGHPAFYKSGVVFDENGEPFEYYRTVALSEYIRYATEMKAR